MSSDNENFDAFLKRGWQPVDDKNNNLASEYQNGNVTWPVGYYYDEEGSEKHIVGVYEGSTPVPYWWNIYNNHVWKLHPKVQGTNYKRERVTEDAWQLSEGDTVKAVTWTAPWDREAILIKKIKKNNDEKIKKIDAAIKMADEELTDDEDNSSFLEKQPIWFLGGSKKKKSRRKSRKRKRKRKSRKSRRKRRKSRKRTKRRRRRRRSRQRGGSTLGYSMPGVGGNHGISAPFSIGGRYFGSAAPYTHGK